MAERLKRKDIDFLHASVMIEKQKNEKSKTTLLLVGIPIFLAVVVGSVVSILLIKTASIREQTVQMNEYLSSSEVSEKQVKLTSLEEKLAKLVTFEDKLTAIRSQTTAQKELSVSTLKQIYQATGSGIQLRSVTYDNDVLSVTATAKTTRGPAKYVDRLRKTGAFSDIAYSGYAKETDGYDFTLGLTMK